MQDSNFIKEQCLECQVNHRRIAVPVRFIEQLVQYERQTLPLAGSHVGGLGIHENRLVISVCLGDGARELTRTKALLLRNMKSRAVWAIEIDDTGAFIEIQGEVEPPRKGTEPWIAKMKSQDGRNIEWLDVERLIGSLERDPGWLQ